MGARARGEVGERGRNSGVRYELEKTRRLLKEASGLPEWRPKAAPDRLALALQPSAWRLQVAQALNYLHSKGVVHMGA